MGNIRDLVRSLLTNKHIASTLNLMHIQIDSLSHSFERSYGFLPVKVKEEKNQDLISLSLSLTRIESNLIDLRSGRKSRRWSNGIKNDHLNMRKKERRKGRKGREEGRKDVRRRRRTMSNSNPLLNLHIPISISTSTSNKIEDLSTVFVEVLDYPRHLGV